MKNFINNLFFVLSHFLPPYFRPFGKSYKRASPKHRVPQTTRMAAPSGAAHSSVTDAITIEGFRHSANTFVSLNIASGGQTVFSHSHRAWSVRSNINRGVPGVFLIRQPLNVAMSMYNRSRQSGYDLQRISVAASLISWIAYHMVVRKYLSHYFVIKFDDVVTRPQEALDKIVSLADLSFFPSASEKFINKFHGVRTYPDLGPLDRSLLRIADRIYADVARKAVSFGDARLSYVQIRNEA